ncbi:DUF5906 domain-containing protein [Herbaspirillum frisingense]|uniref:DUF5906 domain-containing protein n=1 Tax=Herbaspirillum frisingense TaxID=92645 RepID=UPI0039B103E2
MIPQSLKDRKQWLIWRFEPGKKKPLKVPYWPSGKKRHGTQGDEKDRALLGTFDTALMAATAGGFSGIGFAFLPDDGLIGIDIDKCIDGEGVISELAQEVLALCPSYAERSPSRTGFHIICEGKTETFKSNRVGLEVFCGSQFFTFTADSLSPDLVELQPITETALSRLRELVDGGKSKDIERPADPPPALSDRARLESALAYIPADDYHSWIKVGMAVYSVLGDAGFAVWDYWSSKSDGYGGQEDCRKHWKSFGSGVKVTEATIYRLAIDAGWKQPAPAKTGPPRAKAKAKTAADGESPRPPGCEGDATVDAEDEGGPAHGGAEPPPEFDAAAPPAEGAGEVPKKSGKPPKVRPPEFWETRDYLLEHFVLLYGTSTAWDTVNKLQIKVADMRLAFGTDEVKYWLGNSERRMVSSDKLVFDPTGKVDDDPEYVNMYDGFAIEPKKGECGLILELLLHLCDGDTDMFVWIVKWIAYPLQYPGAKMATSIIMHGDEGSGKNLFWEKVVRRIYGQYSWVIGNAQIESQFNEWASRKLFLVCDEVVTRNELKQIKGKLKHMISGEEIPINPKNLPERYEANHMNFVFLSNELQPLALDKTDRRYLVLWTPPKKDEEFYRSVADEIENGGLEAFFYYLREEVDCTDFSPHTKPLDSRAKQNLIALGLTAPERFYREWQAQALPLPFMTCSAMQLYAAFTRWCHLNGERFPPTQTLFGRTVERIAGDALRRKLVEYDLGDGAGAKQRTVYLIGKPAEGVSLKEFAKNGSDLFQKDLNRYRRVYDQQESGGEH